MTDTRTLILMRHAKSGYPGGVRDHDRPLAGRGGREGALAGDWLRESQPSIDAVLCSSATRTRETVAVAGVTAPIRLAAQIYEATPEEILDQIRQTDHDVLTLLVVGHAPGMPGLAMDLAGDGSAGEALERLGAGFPTAAIAVLETESPWDELEFGDARLIAFHIARA